jgi:transcription termination factor Rho
MSNALAALLSRSVEELRSTLRELGVDSSASRWKAGLVTAIARARAEEDVHYGCGVLEVHAEGFGFLRSIDDDLLPGAGDIYVSQSQIRRFNLRTGHTVIGRIRPPKEQERYPALLRVELVDGDAADADVPHFDELAPLRPSTRLPLARDPWLRAVDWVAPLGLGHRGLIVGAPDDARTGILRRLASTFTDEDGIDVTVLLSGERPEEVTAWREEVRAQVIATPFDEQASRQVHVADIVFERARRMAERGHEVLLLIDSLTRLYRSCCAEGSSGGSAGPGALDPQATWRLRRWLATACDLRDAGSVTIIATLNSGSQDPTSAALLAELGELMSWRLTLRDRPAGWHSGQLEVDVQRSWARYEQLLVSDEEFRRRQRWRRDLPEDPAAGDAALAALFSAAPEAVRAEG